jgi:hypothetical protein
LPKVFSWAGGEGVNFRFKECRESQLIKYSSITIYNLRACADAVFILAFKFMLRLGNWRNSNLLKENN